MIRFVRGDILEAPVEALVNTVNCVGVMGRGIALQFKRAHPENFAHYKAACDAGRVEPGRIFVHDLGPFTLPRFILNFPTKRHWRNKSRLVDIDNGLSALVHEIRTLGIRSVAIPPLGCGLGGLNWGEVKPRILASLTPLAEVEVLIYEPGERAQSAASARRAPLRMTPGRAALVGLMDRYLGAFIDPSISLLEIHKLLYFLQEAGEPLKLRFVQARYGPYAENLRHVLRVVEGHLLSGYEDGGDDPRKELELLPHSVEQAEAFLRTSPATEERFERVTTLVEGYETPFGLELLSTVHWVLREDPQLDVPGTVDAVYAWGPGKKQFAPWHVELARDRLRELGWLGRGPRGAAS